MLNPPEFLRSRLAHPVAILGAGPSGRAVLELLGALGVEGTMYDEAPGKAAQAPLCFSAATAARHRLVVFSPGFSPRHPWIVIAQTAGLLCLGEVDFASILWRGRVIAVTGTNGKTSLSELITHALRGMGRDATATGTMEFPFSKLVAERGGGAPDSMAICEVSSSQAETLGYFRADAALWTNFAEDHLDHHHTLQAYFLAKWRLFERAVGGDVFAGSSVQRWASQFGQTLPLNALVATEDQPGDVLLRQTVFDTYPQRENFLLAAAWWRAAGLRESALYAAAQSFQIGPHRLACLGERAGRMWWNDSKATNFHAVEGALHQFRQPVWIILGGKSKGGDVAGFVGRIASKVRHAFLLGEAEPALAVACQQLGVPYTAAGNLAQAVGEAASRTAPGDSILFSPGFSSLDQFHGYDDRGRQFEHLVGELNSPPVFR
ncbi:MAG TPA: UDP-N-acetylmuramoyl-L-alanine--D-glutamate ligase [Opitutaceae bacterium]|jgi:UDP-N-acetylmuramoylalanine--D-glutamate ligase|nr:UDP-N-acetylmuramoyl-L-alanine--D-glutamate ligase [Opitutaceae bacterium]HRE04506.1 UDP-N-acetylmuramoyl-L-alanine--D-glutamate ligase [Opitutaceae bacterium]